MVDWFGDVQVGVLIEVSVEVWRPVAILSPPSRQSVASALGVCNDHDVALAQSGSSGEISQSAESQMLLYRQHRT